MKITICLVTKGREQYIDQVLDSFLPFVEDPDVDIFLVDNGSDSLCERKLAEWQSTHASNCKLFRFATNVSDYSSIWPVILDANIDWIVMPGDDDQLRPEFLKEWKTAVVENPNLVAFASSAMVMDDQGKLSDVVLHPAVANSKSKMDQVATAFHGPAFIWPCLIFRVSRVDSEVPSSRYAFDWWVGLNLLISGDVESTTSIGINYRVHSVQETNLAPLRRKFFEGALWLEDFIWGKPFVRWVESLTDRERIVFWEAVLMKRPIYGDALFGGALMFSLARILINTAEDTSTRSRIVGELASHNGVFLKERDVFSFLSQSDVKIGENLGNVRVILDPSVCDEVMEASQLLTGLANAPEFGITCKHSKRKTGYVFVNCSEFSKGIPTINSDLMINAITVFCESRGDFTTAISSSERRALLLIRSLQNRLPSRLRIFLRRVRNSRVR